MAVRKIIYATILVAIGLCVGCANNEIDTAEYDEILEENATESVANLTLNDTATKKTTQKSANLSKTAPKSNSQKAQNLRDSSANRQKNPQKNPKDLAQDSNANQLDDLQNLQDLVQDSRILGENETDNLAQDSHILNKSAPKARFSFNVAKLNTPIPQLQTNCNAKDFQQCEDLGRIYAVQEKRDLAVAHYKRACDSGKGSPMSCFFLSLMFANSGDLASAREYLSMIDERTLQDKKIDEAELMLSISEIALIKDKLKIFCANGESSACKVLSSVFKIRGESNEAREFFSARCKGGNSASCAILKDL